MIKKGQSPKQRQNRANGLQRRKQNALQTPDTTAPDSSPQALTPTPQRTHMRRDGGPKARPKTKSTIQFTTPHNRGETTREPANRTQSRAQTQTQTEKQAETAAPTSRVHPSQPPPTAVPRAPPAHGPMATGLAANPHSVRTGTQAEKQPKPRAAKRQSQPPPEGKGSATTGPKPHGHCPVVSRGFRCIEPTRPGRHCQIESQSDSAAPEPAAPLSLGTASFGDG